MSKMIHTAGNFQYSVNIAYDIQNSEKLRGFIPTKSSLDLLEEILLSTQNQSTKRARILIGAYGKGKSHIVLTILSILKHHEPVSDFVHLNKKLAENPRLKALVKNYYESGKKLLPVLIGGSGTSLSQSFLVSLKHALSENNLSDFMPETNYRAAIKTLENWKKNYPETLKAFEEKADCPSEIIISRLKDFNLETYRNFEKIYPSLTSGSLFNPFLGFDVVEIYESVAKELRRKNLYDGLYVVYDEFSKYLESNIESASVSDTKMLQDFAEKASRSGEKQLHLLLISHKEIANYIDKLPKQKTDGWRGISERFEHILLNNNFSQVYEIISTVIQKDKNLWSSFESSHKSDFDALKENYQKHEIFKEFREKDGVEKLIKSTFPLHPVSTFILPRLSERIAQNERTLFTFLSADTASTLPSFLKNFNDSDFSLVTPDLIFDYFEPLLKKEIYNGELFETYHLTGVILEKLGANGSELERKIVKTISLIYILGQFEKLKPLTEEIVRIYSQAHSKEEIEAALKNLIEKEFVIYLRQSNSYLKLKETSGVDIKKEIHDERERQKKSFILSGLLNEVNSERYFYPYRYNDQKEMTRFFEFDFVDSEKINDAVSELSDAQSLSKCLNGDSNFSDGKIFALLCKNQEEIEEAKENCKKITGENKQILLVLLKNFSSIEKPAAELSALNALCAASASDEILFSEYRVVQEDLLEVVSSYIKKYTHPENNFCIYFQGGREVPLRRRSHLTELLSDICDDVFSKTPVINNEAINKNDITQMAYNSRRKILAGLLRNPLEKNLGLTGCGQDVAIMRSCLLHTGLLKQDKSDTALSCERAEINLDFEDDKFNLKPMLTVISDFAESAGKEKVNFSLLYEKLISSEFGLGLRKGIIPIYLALIFGPIKNQLVLYSAERQIPLNADSLALLNYHPEEYSLLRFTLDEGKKNYLSELKKIFSSKGETAEEIASAIHFWYLSLPKYSREAKTPFSSFIKAIKDGGGEQKFLFTVLPEALEREKCDADTAQKIGTVKNFYDNLLSDIKNELLQQVKDLFSEKYPSDWIKSLPESSLTHLYADGAENLLSVLKKEPDSESLICQLALAATGLKLEDWAESTKERFISQLSEWKESVEKHSGKNQLESEPEGESATGQKSYAISFPSKNGKSVTKYFEKVSESVRAKLLFNKVTDALETMGKSMSEAEKRQVLMDVLQKMCGGDD